MKHLFYYFIIITCFAGCKKSDRLHQGQPDQPFPPFIQEKVRASIHGYITDEKNQPLEQARVFSGDKITSTNSDGFFFLNDIELGKTVGKITVEFPGYFGVTKTFIVVEGSVNYVKVQLIPFKIIGDFQTANGGKIDFGSGSEIEIASNSMVFEGSDITYNGEVIVSGVYLDPTDPKIGYTMPGNLMGLSSDNAMKQLKTFGMITVILQAPQGDHLDLADGKTATIKVPIPTSQLSTAPATMPLWFFDETSGLWREDGFAVKDGNFYSGKVSHFSTWNLDVPYPYVFLTMKLTSKEGGSFPFHPVKITNILDGAFTWATTDSGGVVESLVPRNAVLLREIYNFCGEIVSSQQMGPFAVSTDLGSVSVFFPSTHLINIRGTAKNCAGIPVENGFADIYLDGMYHRATITNGGFSYTTNRCTSELTVAHVTVTDMVAGQYGTETTVSVGSGNYQLDNLLACGSTFGQYLNFTLSDTVSFAFTSPADSIFADTQQHTYIGAYKGGQPQVSAEFGYYADSIPGTYWIGYMNVKTAE